MSKIDWKEFSSSKGYISLKKAYIKDVQDVRRETIGRSKKELYRTFRRVIGDCIKLENLTGMPIIEILNFFENNRTYWWLGYYNKYSMRSLLLSHIEKQNL